MSPKKLKIWHHFETNAQRPGWARPLSVISSCSWKRFCLGKHVCILEVMADLQPYRFEPERVPNPEDCKSENEEVNNRLEGTFWCSCERYQIVQMHRECVYCWEQPEEGNKIEGRILSLYYICCSKRQWHEGISCITANKNFWWFKLSSARNFGIQSNLDYLDSSGPR